MNIIKINSKRIGSICYYVWTKNTRKFIERETCADKKVKLFLSGRLFFFSSCYIKLHLSPPEFFKTRGSKFNGFIDPLPFTKLLSKFSSSKFSRH